MGGRQKVGGRSQADHSALRPLSASQCRARTRVEPVRVGFYEAAHGLLGSLFTVMCETEYDVYICIYGALCIWWKRRWFLVDEFTIALFYRRKTNEISGFLFHFWFGCLRRRVLCVWVWLHITIYYSNMWAFKHLVILIAARFWFDFDFGHILCFVVYKHACCGLPVA